MEAGFHEIPMGAYNIRANGKGLERKTTANIDIVPKDSGSSTDQFRPPVHQR